MSPLLAGFASIFSLNEVIMCGSVRNYLVTFNTLLILALFSSPSYAAFSVTCPTPPTTGPLANQPGACDMVSALSFADAVSAILLIGMAMAGIALLGLAIRKAIGALRGRFA